MRFLIWDAGGTLFDSYPATVTAFQETLATWGHTAPRARIRGLCKHSLEHCTEVLSQDAGVDKAALYRAFRTRYEAMPLEAQYPFPGVANVCAAVCAHGGKNFVLTHRGRASLLGLLEAHHLTDYFTDYITGDDPYPRKPDPAAMLALIDRHHLDPGETLAIGDREIDMVAARAAGIQACFFGTELHVPVDFRITNFSQLLRILLEAWGQIEFD